MLFLSWINDIATEFVGSVMMFPVWWYGVGLIGVIGWAHRSLGYIWRGYAIPLWMRYIFVPMYGSYDWSGRVVSFVMRVVVIIGRSVAFFVVSLWYIFCVLLWMFAPVGFLFLLVLPSFV